MRSRRRLTGSSSEWARHSPRVTATAPEPYAARRSCCSPAPAPRPLQVLVEEGRHSWAHVPLGLTDPEAPALVEDVTGVRGGDPVESLLRRPPPLRRGLAPAPDMVNEHVEASTGQHHTLGVENDLLVQVQLEPRAARADPHRVLIAVRGARKHKAEQVVRHPVDEVG